MKYIKTWLILIAFIVGLPLGVYKLATFLMKLETSTLWIIFGAVIAVLFALWAWLINQDEFEPPTFVWHDSNKVLHEINDKLDK